MEQLLSCSLKNTKGVFRSFLPRHLKHLGDSAHCFRIPSGILAHKTCCPCNLQRLPFFLALTFAKQFIFPVDGKSFCVKYRVGQKQVYSYEYAKQFILVLLFINYYIFPIGIIVNLLLLQLLYLFTCSHLLCFQVTLQLDCFFSLLGMAGRKQERYLGGPMLNELPGEQDRITAFVGYWGNQIAQICLMSMD